MDETPTDGERKNRESLRQLYPNLSNEEIDQLADKLGSLYLSDVAHLQPYQKQSRGTAKVPSFDSRREQLFH